MPKDKYSLREKIVPRGHELKREQYKAVENYKFFRDPEILRNIHELEFRGFKNTWQTRLILVLMVNAYAIDIAKFAQNVKENKSRSSSKTEYAKAKYKPRSERNDPNSTAEYDSPPNILQEVEKIIPQNFTQEEVDFVRFHAATMSDEDLEMIRQCKNFAVQNSQIEAEESFFKDKIAATKTPVLQQDDSWYARLYSFLPQDPLRFPEADALPVQAYNEVEITSQDLVKKVEQHLSSNFTESQKKFIAQSIATIPQEGRKIVSNCIDLVDHYRTVFKYEDKNFIQPFTEKAVARWDNSRAYFMSKDEVDWIDSYINKNSLQDDAVPASINLSQKNFFGQPLEKAASIFLHETVHCIESMVENVKKAKVVDSRTNAMFSLDDFSKIISNEEVAHYLDEYAKFAHKIKKITNEPAFNENGEFIKKDAPFFDDSELNNYILKIGLSCIKNGRYIKESSNKIPFTVFADVDYHKFMDADYSFWESVAADNTDFFHKAKLFELGLAHLTNFANIIGRIDRQRYLRNKFSEMMAYFTEIPQSLLKVMDIEMFEAIDAARSKLMQEADKKIAEKRDIIIESYEVDGEGNKKMVGKVKASKYQSLAQSEERQKDREL